MLTVATLAILAFAAPGHAQNLIEGNYYWYAPEHERYSPTSFYREPRFEARSIRPTRTQRFRLLSSRRGWFQIEFDIAGKAYIHQRLLGSLVYNPATGDPWAEFERASVFEEDPARIKARIQSVSTNPNVAEPDGKTPSWKRYKDSWGIKQGRTASSLPAVTPGDSADATLTPLPSRTQDRKPKSKYSLLPPIGSDQSRTNPEPESTPAPDGANVPSPQLP